MSFTHWLTRLLLSFATLAVILAVAEGGVRVAQRAGWMLRYDSATVFPEPRFAARLIPSENETLFVEHDAADPAINAEGVRDFDYPIEKPADVFRILVLGDSVTFGLGVEQQHSYPKVLEALLNGKRESYGAPRYEVMNFGVSGYGTPQELELYRLKGAKYTPDLILVGYVLNDPLLPRFMFEALEDRAAKVESLDALAGWSQALAFVWYRLEVIQTARERPGNYRFMYEHEEAWNAIAEAIDGFAQIGRSQDIPVVLVVFPLLEDFTPYAYREVHAQLSDQARRSELPLLDLLGAYLEESVDALKLHPLDATHPNERGHRIAAERIRDYLESEALLR